MRLRGFDLSQYGLMDPVGVANEDLACIFGAAQYLHDSHRPELLAIYMEQAQEELKQQADRDEIDHDWITRALMNMAVQGLLGRAIPDCIDIEE
jgi:hypothetical protein